MSKKKPLLLATFSGILLSIPWLLPHAGWLMLAAFLPLLLADEMILKNRDSLSAIFNTSFLAFLIWNVATCWWIAHVSFWGMFLITVLNSLLMASVWWGKSFVRKRLGKTSGYFALISFWIAFEFLHHHWSLRWPWLALGNGFADSVKLIQWYEYSGVLGGSFWILLSNILLFKAIYDLNHRNYFEKFNGFVIAFLAISLPVTWSLIRYHNYHEKTAPTEIVVLQPNIDPFTEKFSGMTPGQQVNRVIDLADSAVSQSTNFALAPETALPDCSEDSLLTQNQKLAPILNFLKKYPGIDFIAGAITKHRFAAHETPSETARFSADNSYLYDLYNSSVLIDTSADVQICHKSILVSGVERMPFQEYFSFLKKYLINLGGSGGSFAAAKEPEVFSTSGDIKIGPVICFESAFGAQSAALIRKGAQILLVMTNDGWWRKSPGVRQHFNYARLRAIETRRSVARSANTGISGFINQRGDVLEQTRIDETCALTGKLNRNREMTFYVRHEKFLGVGGLIFTFLILIYLLLHRVKTKIN